ncbi:hypothetical protein MRX96_019347 [Rhipicephalus microplus]
MLDSVAAIAEERAQTPRAFAPDRGFLILLAEGEIIIITPHSGLFSRCGRPLNNGSTETAAAFRLCRKEWDEHTPFDATGSAQEGRENRPYLIVFGICAHTFLKENSRAH